MTTFFRVQASIPSDTTVPRDAAVNTWHARTDAVDPQDGYSGFVNRLITFYAAIDQLFSLVCASPIAFKVYNLEDAEPRVPVYDTTSTFTPSASGGLPTENAICLSFKADPISGVSPARLRGRLYLGPLDTATVSTSGGRVTVQGSTRTTIVNAADALAGPEVADGGEWCVFSPTTAGAPPWSNGALDLAFKPVTSGYVDDAWDTQRRRGTAPSARTSFAV